MRKQEDELIKQFLEKLKRPKAEQFNQQTPSSLKRSRQAAREAMIEKRRQLLKKKEDKEDTRHQD